MWQTLGLISLGASFGACLRWGLGWWLNPLFHAFSFGTFIANSFGCFLAGILLACIWQYPQISSEWRLFFITGFLGSLTTFSALSSEIIVNLFTQKWLVGLGILSLHLIGGLLCTALGVWLVKALLN